MTGEPAEETMMLPYQIYQALSEERTRELVAAAKRRELVAAAKRHDQVAAARYDSRDATASSSRLNGLTARIMSLLNASRGARARSTVTSARGGGSTMTSGSAAGPIGCSA
jgi:hypothetical protein